MTRSVRIDKDADERLSHLAKEDETSVNLLVNRALRKFVDWDSIGEKFGFVTLPSELLVRMMDALTEEQVLELGLWAGRSLVKEYITFWFKDMTSVTLLEGFPKLFAKYGRAFEYEEFQEDGVRTIILKHGAGAKWSTFYREALRTTFREHLQRDIRIDASENQIVLHLRQEEKASALPKIRGGTAVEA